MPGPQTNLGSHKINKIIKRNKSKHKLIDFTFLHYTKSEFKIKFSHKI